MYRRRPSTLALLAALLTVLTVTACSNAAEQPILNQFFRASRLRDNTSLQNFATVAFDPRTEGVITSYDITSVSAERRRPLTIKTLAQALDDAKGEDTAYTKRKDEYYLANIEAIQRALKAERDKAKLKGKDAEVQAAWVKFRQEGSQVSKRVGEAKSKLIAESRVADLSFADQRTPPDFKKYDGELVTKDVTVSAPVKTPNGQTVKKTVVITMQRVILKGDREMTGHWVITALKDASAPVETKTS